MASVRKNLGATFYSYVASIGGQLLLVPVYIHCWGAERYGWWLVLYAIPACFTFLDAGIGNSLGNALTIAYQRKEFRQAQQMLNAVWKYQTLGSSIGFALFVAVIVALPIRRWLALESLGSCEFAIASLLLCLCTLFSIQLGVFTAIFRAGDRFAQFIRWHSHIRLLEVGATILALTGGAGIVGVALTLVSVKGVLLAICWRWGRGVLPELKIVWSDAPWVEFRRLLAAGLAFMVIPAGAGIINQGSAILLNHTLGPLAVVTLSVCRQLARLYYSLINVLCVALHPEMTSAYAVGDRERLQAIYVGGLGAVLWTALPAMLVMVFAGPFVIKIWTKSAVQVGHMLMLACGVEAVVAVLGQNAALPSYASNRHVAICGSYLLCTIAGFVIAPFLLAWGGVTVVPVCFAATALAFTGHAFLASSAVVQATPGELFRRCSNPRLWVKIVSGQPTRASPLA